MFDHNIGEKAVKESVLNSLDEKWAMLHREGYIHIHDLDAYGLTYNCLTFDLLKAFPYSDFARLSSVKAILGVFDFLKELFERVGNEQSGGMALANFDNDLASIFTTLGVDYKSNKEIFLRRDPRSYYLVQQYPYTDGADKLLYFIQYRACRK